jgi:NADPH:quinone reductase-like Zn-dependent oxidoreductase
MKAVRIHTYGGLDVLKYEEIGKPEPDQGEVFIRVFAAGVNPSDAKIREGKAFALKYEKPFPFILGWDVSGVVEAVGKGDGQFKPGDAVFGMVNFPYGGGGAYAEYVTAPAGHVAYKPSSLDHVHAAALPLAGLTAWQALFDAAQLSGGEKILIHAAAGGVGHLLVQLAKWKGASSIIGTASARDEQYLKRIGLDEFIDYRTAKFEEVVHEVDTVLDCVGGDTQERSWQVIKKGGILVTIMEPPSQEKAKAFGVRAERIFVRAHAGQLKLISELVDQGLLKPAIYREFPLFKARDAHKLIEKGQTRGKIVFRVVNE